MAVATRYYASQCNPLRDAQARYDRARRALARAELDLARARGDVAHTRALRDRIRADRGHDGFPLAA